MMGDGGGGGGGLGRGDSQEIILHLKQQLHEKEMKLTDIRLEALSSAHQLEQLRDAMNQMKVNSPSDTLQDIFCTCKLV